MLLPPDMLNKLYYYHHTYKNSTDIVTVVYQGWFWKTSKIFKFGRIAKAKIIGGTEYYEYSKTQECIELINQLHEKMEQKIKEKQNETP